MKKIKPAITLGILGMMLTIGICIQLKTINAADISGTVQLTDSNLKNHYYNGNLDVNTQTKN